jgi:hypothetical protein
VKHVQIPNGRVAFFAAHFLFILLVACHDSFSIFSSSSTLFPTALDPVWSKGAAAVDISLGQDLSPTNPLRQILWGYLNAAGIEAGYSYFAPNVPDNYKIVFELHYPDGHTEFELPEVSGRATGLRLSTLLDVVAETEYEPLRAMMVKMMAYAVWQDHPEAVKVRAVVGDVDLPTPAEFRRGQKESYRFLFGYDFDFASANTVNH